MEKDTFTDDYKSHSRPIGGVEEFDALMFSVDPSKGFSLPQTLDDHKNDIVDILNSSTEII